MFAMSQGKVLRCGMSEQALGCAQAGMQEVMIKTWLLLSFCKLTLLIGLVEGLRWVRVLVVVCFAALLLTLVHARLDGRAPSCW